MQLAGWHDRGCPLTIAATVLAAGLLLLLLRAVPSSRRAYAPLGFSASQRSPGRLHTLLHGRQPALALLFDQDAEAWLQSAQLQTIAINDTIIVAQVERLSL